MDILCCLENTLLKIVYILEISNKSTKLIIVTYKKSKKHYNFSSCLTLFGFKSIHFFRQNGCGFFFNQENELSVTTIC